MPFWPFYMAVCAGLALWGLRYPGAWVAPALVLAGLVAERGIITGLHPAAHELSSCALWLCIAILLGYKGAWVPAFFCGLSAGAYVFLAPLGFQIERLGFMPILADLFLVLGLVGITGGLLSLAGSGADRGLRPNVGGIAFYSLGVATR